MLTKNDLLSRLSVLEKEVQENGEKQRKVKAPYKGKIAELEKSIKEKEQEKKKLNEKKPFFSFTRAGKEHAEKIAAIDEAIEEIRDKIDHIYDDNEEYIALTSRFSVLYPEYVAVKEQIKEFEFNEKLGQNTVIIYATGFNQRDYITVSIDGKEMGSLPSPVGIYPLNEGAHTVTVGRNYGMTESFQFRLQGNNKFLYYEFEYYGNGYKKRASNTFDEFVKDNGIYIVEAIKKHILEF